MDLAETDENGNENERGNENENGKGRQDYTFCGIGRRSCKQLLQCSDSHGDASNAGSGWLSCAVYKCTRPSNLDRSDSRN